ncbi:MAG: hypothetical protein U9N59_14575 [Campylobacterota bacterium]|nr:hypothetical protein [Campylobacterota bacterium]
MELKSEIKKHLSFWFIIAGLIFFLIIRVLVQDGMSLDGLIYATLSKNMAVGIGSIFSPRISEYYWPHFFEHPPLGMYLESLYFKLFGLSYLSERLYSLTTLVVMIVAIQKFWSYLVVENEKNYSWLPVLLYLSVPLVFWAYTQNVLENMMSLFSFFAVITIIIAMKVKSTVNQIVLLALSSILIVASFFTKGPPSVFPLATLFIYFLFYKNISLKKAIILNGFVMSIFILLIYILLLNDNIYHSISTYLNTQVLASLEGTRSTNGGRFKILHELFFEILPILFISLLVFLFTKNKLIDKSIDVKRGLFFISIGLSASLPIIISQKQHGMYLIPSFVYFALGFSFLILPRVVFLVEKIKKVNVTLYFTIAFFVISILFTILKIGNYDRDESVLNDLDLISKSISDEKLVAVQKNIYYKDNVNAYFMRYYNISLDEKGKHKYLLLNKQGKLDLQQQQRYKKVNLTLTHYSLYIQEKREN